MAGQNNRKLARTRRHLRLRKTLHGTSDKPRLSVFRSGCHIYAQIIDDDRGHTLAACSTLDSKVKAEAAGKEKTVAAHLVGTLVAKRALEQGIVHVAFDRGGYKFHGHVKSLAEAARGEGLLF